jgi:hypothetical protein
MIDLKAIAGDRYRITVDESATIDTAREARRWYYRIPCKYDTDREISASFDRQASATNSVSFLGLFPPKTNKTVSFFVSFHRRATQP